MLQVIVRRLLWAIPLLLGVSLLVFVLASFAPGSVAGSMLGIGATPDAVAALNAKLGLDKPILVQYWDWLTQAVRGNLGASVFDGQSVTSVLASRLPVTLSLTILGLLFVVVLGMTVGAYSAIRGGIFARILEFISVLLRAIPNFWLALVLVTLLAVQFRFFPVSGYVPLAQSPQKWLNSLVLPVTALAIGDAALVAIVTRAEMLKTLRSDFVKGLRANGLPGRTVLFKHVMKNAASPVLTIVSLTFVGLLGSTILMEQVFGMAGLGSAMVAATTNHDLPVIQGLVVFYTLVVVIVFLLNDIAHVYLNPKVLTR